MIKLGLKNYCKSYKFFFVPLGALSLGIVIGLSVMIPMLWSAVKDFVSGVAEAAGNFSVHWDEVKDLLFSSVSGLPWDNPQAVADEVFVSDYWYALLQECAATALGDISALEAEMAALAEKALATIAGGAMLFVFFTILGGFVGYYVTRSMIRTGVAKRSFLKSILASLLGTLINLTIIAAGVVLIAKSKQYAILSFLLTILVYGASAFLQAYFVHGYKKVPFKKVMSLKNFFLLALLNLIEIVIMAALIVLLKSVTNTTIAVYAGFAVAIITISCLQLNAEAYVKSLADNPEAEKIEAADLANAYQGLAPVAFADKKAFSAKGESAEAVLAADAPADSAPKEESDS